MKNKSSKQTDLSYPFNRWLAIRKMTTDQFREEAKKRGLPFPFSTVCSWRMGRTPRKMALAMLKAKFPGIKF